MRKIIEWIFIIVGTSVAVNCSKLPGLEYFVSTLATLCYAIALMASGRLKKQL